MKCSLAVCSHSRSTIMLREVGPNVIWVNHKGRAMSWIRIGISFLLAVIVGTVVVTVIATQVNLAALSGAGAEIGLSVRLDATLRDLGGFAPILGPILLIGYCIAFWVAHLVIRRAPGLHTFGYALAGFVTIVVTMYAIDAYYAVVFNSGITAVPAARTFAGLLLMSAGGALGGVVFALGAPRR